MFTLVFCKIYLATVNLYIITDIVVICTTENGIVWHKKSISELQSIIFHIHDSVLQAIKHERICSAFTAARQARTLEGWKAGLTLMLVIYRDKRAKHQFC